MRWFNKIWQAVVHWFRAGDYSGASAAPKTTTTPPPVSPETPSPEIPSEYAGSRAERRALASERRKYERARKKHDRFVKPEGVSIEPQTKEHREHKDRTFLPPRPILEEPENKERLIVDKHYYSGGNDDVLYEHSEFYGEFNFRDTILDQLERYWIYLDRMRKHDPDSYDFYKQLGAVIIPTPTFIRGSDDIGFKKLTPEEVEKHKKDVYLTPWFKQHRPGFGCVAWGIDPRSEYREMQKTQAGDKKGKVMSPKFFYFIKYDRPPPNVELHHGGSVYKLTVWWDLPQDKTSRFKYGRPTEYAVHVAEDGQLRVLRVLGFHGGYWRDWAIPRIYKEWAAEHGLDVQLHLTHIFCDALRWIEYSQYSMIRVYVTKGDMTAVFSVNHQKLGYFFQDRDIVINDHGQRVKIFHTVRAHERQDGTTVKLHFRGARQFTWAGYDVMITVPGYHHLDFADYDGGVVDGHWIGGNPRSWKKKGYITEREFGRHLSEMIKRGTGAWNRKAH